MKKVDYIVIGGGISGLLMTSLLSLKNYDVCLLEAAPKLGGYFQNVTRDKVPYGAHHIAIPDREKFERFFKAFHIDLTSSLLPANHITILYDNKRYELSLLLDELQNNLIKYFEEESVSIVQFINYIKKFANALQENNEEQMKQFFLDTVFISFEQLLHSYFRNEQLKGLLSAIGPSYGDVYIEDSAFTFISLMATYGSGTYYFKHYGEQLLHQLHRFIEDQGNEIICKFKVVNIEPNSYGYSIRSDQGKEMQAKHIIISCYPLPFIQQLPCHTKAQQNLVAKMSNLQVGASAWRVYYKVDQILDNKEYIYHGATHRNLQAVEKLNNFIISTMHKEAGQINVMATIVTDNMTKNDMENIYEQQLRQKVMAILEVEEQSINFCSMVGPNNREALTANQNGSVFGWSRDVKGNLQTNTFNHIHQYWENIYVIGHWSNTFGVYGSLLTVMNAMRQLDRHYIASEERNVTDHVYR